MMYRDGIIQAVRRAWGAQGNRCLELDVTVTAAPAGATAVGVGTQLRAVVYERVLGMPEVGEHVRVEVSALARGLGTGGHAMVIDRLDVLMEDSPAAGHLVKARYTPTQVMVTGVDEQDTPDHGLLTAPAGELTLEGVPVLVTDLHSALPALLAGLTSPAPGSQAAPARTVYVMTDGGALPACYSRTVAALRETGWLAGTVSCGQAWGGEVEAASLHNALLAARHVLGGQVIIVIQGPGNLGTDTPWGFSGLAVGDAVNAVAALGGRAVAALRVSQADARERHLGVSHHSLTALGRVAMAGADVVVPDLRTMESVPRWLAERVLDQAACLGQAPSGAPHRLVRVDVAGLDQALATCEQATGVRLSTMGRGLDEDPASFLAAAAAGRYVASLRQE